jgi:Flp pilus assembly protein TadD
VLLAVLTGALRCTPAQSPVDQALHLVRVHDEARAVAVLRTHLASHPDDLRARRLLVRVLALGGDMGAARAEVARLAELLGPSDPTPWIELGHACELTHAFEEALEAYDEAAQRAPASPAGPREGGLRAARWGEAEAAIPRLEEAVRRGAKDPEVFHALGLARLRIGDADGAEAAYRAGVAADPDSAENVLGLATVALTRSDWAGALRAYEILCAKRPTFAPAELGRAFALAKLGRVREARAALDRAEALGAPKENVAKQRSALAGR